MEIHEVPRRRRLVGAMTLGAVAVLAIVTLALTSGAFAAQAPVSLGTTASYAVLAGTTVTNTGPTLVTGDLGLSPGSSVTGFPPGLVIGTVNVANAPAIQAQSDLVTAYNDAAGRTPATTVAGDTLGGLTLTAGVYSGGALDLTGTLTLDAQGDSSAVFIFQAASTLITASSSVVKLDNGANPCNVFWQVGSSATLGTTTTFKGTILALTSIGLNTGATVDGRLLARNGAVTLDTNTINAQACAPIRTATSIVTQVHNPSHVDITNSSVVAGTAVHDSAIVTGASPSGTVTYHFYATGQGTCTGATSDQTVAVGLESSAQTLAVGSYAYSADYNGDSTNLPSIGACEPFSIRAAPPADTRKPICIVPTAIGTDSSGRKFVEATVQDTGSGLATIVVTKSINANTVVPPFTPGTTLVVTIRSTKIDQSLGSSFEIRATDVAGNSILCDPVLTTTVRDTGKPAGESFSGLAQTESTVTLVNGNPGLNRIDVTVNGTTYKLTGLKDSGTRTLDVSASMKPGSANSITVTGHGSPNGSATVVISD